MEKDTPGQRQRTEVMLQHQAIGGGKAESSLGSSKAWAGDVTGVEAYMPSIYEELGLEGGGEEGEKVEEEEITAHPQGHYQDFRIPSL